jgi:hypothetical protein
MTALLLFAACSCSKKGIETGLLIGNWNVTNDSSLNSNKFYTLPAGDSGISSSNYLAEQCGATFNFDSSGNLVTSFFNCSYAFPSIDLAKYVLAGNQITISIFARNSGCCSYANLSPVITRTYTISNLTANTARLTFKSIDPSPSTEIINLKK